MGVNDIKWTKSTLTLYTYTHGEFTFKKRTHAGERYEIWRDGELRRNNMGYFAFVKVAGWIMQYGKEPAGEWWK